MAQDYAARDDDFRDNGRDDDDDRGPARGESYNDEIVALLHQVGQRLLNSEQDRRELKRAMDDLVEKSDQGERAYLTLQDRINKTESLIEKRQRAIEAIQKEQMERVERAAAMADKIEEAIAQNARINRRLDKLSQDKARTIRKLERIEQAVLETHDVLNARVLAAPRTESAKSPEDNEEDVPFKNWLPQAAAANDGAAGGEKRPWWKQHTAVRVGAVSAMVLIGVAGGFAVSNMRGGFDLDRPLQTAAAPQSQAASHYETEEAPSFGDLAAYQEPAPQADPDKESFTRAIEQALDEPAQPQAASPAEAPATAAPKTAVAEKPKAAEPDPMEMDDEELVARFEQDPDALAAQLNEISPATAASIIDEVHNAAPAGNKKAEPAAFTPQKAEIKEVTTAQFIEGQKDGRPLAERIQPDATLPAVIHEVEKKAYEGIPEAHHDLAAIYTAGHGGVEINYPRAAQWFRESALSGVANARYNLGVLYHQGLGVKQDINTAVSWYRAAAEMGHPEAQYNLGIAYIEGIGTRYNPDKAAHYFEKAAKQGIMEAAYNLGLIHENGLTGTSRPDQALYWYKQAADKGSPEAKVAMDQLAKTLGVMPNEIEHLYGDKKDKKAEADSASPATASEASRETAAAPAAAGGVEYIEAVPLEDPAPAPVAALENEVIEDEGIAAADAKVATTDAVASPPAKSSAKKENFDPAVIAQIQEQLIRLGLYPGPADGVNDTLTEDAIRAYQTNYNLAADGRPSQALLVHMMTSDLGDNEYGSRSE